MPASNADNAETHRTGHPMAAGPGIRFGDLRVEVRRSPRARRYGLRILDRDSLLLTIPRGGSPAAALAFAQRHTEWIARNMARYRTTTHLVPSQWTVGTSVLVRGEWHTLQATPFDDHTVVTLGPVRMAALPDQADWRPTLEPRLRALAVTEIAARAALLAAAQGLRPGRITVRAQRTRWGSCSSTGTISLNWRLIFCPPSVEDYIIIHELSHLRELNHSSRFWAAVKQACPAYLDAEAWLKAHRGLLTDA